MKKCDIERYFLKKTTSIKDIKFKQFKSTFPDEEVLADDKKHALWLTDKTVEIHICVKKQWAILTKYCASLQKMMLAAVNLNSTILAKRIGGELDELKKRIPTFSGWRWEDGMFLKSPAVIKCCGGYAHGWDSINRVFIMESMMFDTIGKERQDELFKEVSFKKKEEVEALLKNSLLVENRKPIKEWDTRTIFLQLRAICQRWNHISSLAYDKHLRKALFYMVSQIELRSYQIVRSALDYPELLKKESSKEGGLESKTFDGRIVCTPNNNYGMSIISSSGSWLDKTIWRISRTTSKIMSLLIWLEKLVPVDDVILLKDIKEDMFGKTWEKDIERFRKSAHKYCNELIESKQIQNSISKSIYPSIVGLDSDIRQGEFSMNSLSEKNCSIWATSSAMVHRPCDLWIKTYLRIAKSDYYLSSKMSEGFPDLESICVFHSFESATKRDNRNSFGFLDTFFARLECASQKRYTLTKDMKNGKVPYIMKVGAEYCVITSYKTGLVILCENAVEAIMTWCALLEKLNHWFIADDCNVENIYKPIFYGWMKKDVGQTLVKKKKE